MELAIILLPLLAFALVKGHLDRRARLEERRIELLEDALKTGRLDRQDLEAVARALGAKAPPPIRPGNRLLAVLLALGWITLFTGGGIGALGGMSGDEDTAAAGLLVGIIGFGLVTYPFALRELEARKAAS
ncbi:MAG: hypothetical protein Fur0037_24530 [Planctomycetota bacterium]